MYGQLSALQLNEQNSFGTAFTSSLFAVPVINESLNKTVAQIVEDNMYQRFGESPSHEGVNAIDGSIQIQPEPDGIGYFLKAAFGQVTTTSDTNDQTHVFRPVDVDFDNKAALPPFSFLLDRDVNSNMLYSDCLVNNITIEAANGELLSLSVDIIGGTYADNASVAATFTDFEPFPWDTSSVQFNGVFLGDLRSFTLQVANNLETVYTLAGSRTPDKIKRTGMVNVTGTLVLDFASNSLMTEFLNQNERQLFLNFESRTNSPAEFLIDIALMRITEYTVGVAGPGINQLNMNFVGKYDVDSSYAIQITLINTKDVY